MNPYHCYIAFLKAPSKQRRLVLSMVVLRLRASASVRYWVVHATTRTWSWLGKALALLCVVAHGGVSIRVQMQLHMHGSAHAHSCIRRVFTPVVWTQCAARRLRYLCFARRAPAPHFGTMLSSESSPFLLVPPYPPWEYR